MTQQDSTRRQRIDGLKPIVVLGEVLFDIFEDGNRILGGAPFNVSWNLTGAGLQPLFVTSVGNDAEGESIIHAMRDWQMPTAGVQNDDRFPTGQVDVSIADGEPEYVIENPCAYDRLSFEKFEQATAGRFDSPALLYHGSLAFRGKENQDFLQQLKQLSNVHRFVDLNIRAPWFDKADLPLLISDATWLKLNQDELQKISGRDVGDDADAMAAAIASFSNDVPYPTPAKWLVTCGAKGAFWFDTTTDHYLFAKSPTVRTVIDTVGAGDAFAAACIAGIANNLSPEENLQRAVEFAASACTIQGATIADVDHYAGMQYTSVTNKE